MQATLGMFIFYLNPSGNQLHKAIFRSSSVGVFKITDAVTGERSHLPQNATFPGP